MNTPEMGEILEVRVLEYDFAGTRTRTRKSPYSPTSGIHAWRVLQENRYLNPRGKKLISALKITILR